MYTGDGDPNFAAKAIQQKFSVSNQREFKKNLQSHDDTAKISRQQSTGI